MISRARFLWFGAIVAFSLYSRHSIDAGRQGRCSVDGNRIAPIHRVDLVRDGVALASFCCVRCASDWPDVPEGAHWRVRDEVTGALLSADEAIFVTSTVVTVPSRMDRTHVFARGQDAMAHCNQFGGVTVDDPLPRR